MIDNVDDAIKHCKENIKGCDQCSLEHEQLMNYLIEYKYLKEKEIMKDFVKRMIEEHSQLIVKINKLYNFLYGNGGLNIHTDIKNNQT